ncbi:mtDNA inheritance, partitioning of the mitochondrial organelle [Emydomyces testavorans]|uniref:Protein DML1 n=1 Tax=Emydomyces testavorans TaxID=2070801 RepID=A0AAF0DAQ6_9EURO|nr:mtDNA inheritance, partitioning of the mitochondrial organelle [Emydomyces testavorans]
MHEIITLQLGQRSNYLATHFWNVQESYFTYSENEISPVDHDVSFRSGIGVDGSETFTPRTLVYDLKGGFGSLRQYNALYEVEGEAGLPKGLWDGNEVVQRQAVIPQNEYQKNLELGLPLPRLTPETVRYWSDFNRLFYHPKSIVQISEYDVNSQLMPFEDWTVGETLFNTLDQEHDLLDRDFRPFAEGCDQLRGIQMFTGTDDAWGGFAARYIDRLRDEYGKKNIWTWASEGGAGVEREKGRLRATNSAKSISEIARQATAYIPISMPPPSKLPHYVNLDMRSEWYFSALASMAVESVTLPARLRWHDKLGSWWFDHESPQRIFTLSATIRAQASESNSAHQSNRGEFMEPTVEEDHNDEIEQTEKSFDLKLSSIGTTTQENMHLFSRVQVIRESRENSSQPKRPEVGQGLTAQRVTLTGYIPSVLSSFKSTLEFPILDSFPSDLIENQGPPGSTLGINVALSATSAMGKDLKALRQKIGQRVYLEERENLLNGLSELSEAYEAHWESGSDSGDD